MLALWFCCFLFPRTHFLLLISFYQDSFLIASWKRLVLLLLEEFLRGNSQSVSHGIFHTVKPTISNTHHQQNLIQDKNNLPGEGGSLRHCTASQECKLPFQQKYQGRKIPSQHNQAYALRLLLVMIT